MEQSQEIKILHEKIQTQNHFFQLLKKEMNRVIIGQNHMIDRLLIGLLGNGHILLEGVPGLAKTLAIKTLSDAVDGHFSRIQFTPDLLPADVIGTQIYNIKENNFSIKKGPIFANFVLADEINRAPSKVQAALLEAMQEKQVTIGDETFPLPIPFLVLATQNPIDQEGTYLLPEAQTDRFMLKCEIDYPDFEDERQIMRMASSTQIPSVKPIISMEHIIEAKQLINKNHINFGASPRASINLAIAAKALAFLKNRAFVIPEDVKKIAKDVLRHRIGLSFEAEAENINTNQIIDRILGKIQAP